jgi:hypothetical protein
VLANARRLREALVDFGFGDVAPSAEELATPDCIFMLGRKPQRTARVARMKKPTEARLEPVSRQQAA